MDILHMIVGIIAYVAAYVSSGFIWAASTWVTQMPPTLVLFFTMLFGASTYLTSHLYRKAKTELYYEHLENQRLNDILKNTKSNYNKLEAELSKTLISDTISRKPSKGVTEVSKKTTDKTGGFNVFFKLFKKSV